MQPRFGLICATLFLAGCGGDSANERDQVVCTTELRPGITVTVQDASGAPASCGAQAVITAAGYSETVQNPAGPGCVNSLVLSGAAERPGQYTVTVSKQGFPNVVFNNVAVSADVCHVITVPLTASF